MIIVIMMMMISVVMMLMVMSNIILVIVMVILTMKLMMANTINCYQITLYNVPNLEGNIFVNGMILGLAEMSSGVISGFMMSYYSSR